MSSVSGCESVGDDVEPLAAEVDRRAVRQVSAVRQAHAEDRVAGLERGEEDGLVRLRAGMRLHVREIGVEELLRPVDRELLDDVDVLAAAVIALARIAFRVLVGELRALRRQHRRARVVLRGDELDVIFLAPVLGGNGSPDVGVVLGDRVRAMEHGGSRRGERATILASGTRAPCSTRASTAIIAAEPASERNGPSESPGRIRRESPARRFARDRRHERAPRSRSPTGWS